MSVTEIRSDSKQQTVQVSCRMFTDDLQSALYQRYQYKADLNQKNAQNDSSLARYIAERLQLEVSGKALTWHFVGYEIEGEATWCYLEASSFPGTGPAKIQNRLLYDYLPEQTNLIHFYRDGQRSSWKLVNPETFVEL